MVTLVSTPAPEIRTEVAPLRLVVPVDASAASVRAVDFAIKIAQVGLSEIMLVALVPEPKPDDGLDPDLIRALLMETKMGLGLGQIVPEADERIRVRQRYDLVLLPLERRVNAAGVPVKLRVLRGEGLAEQLRELLGGSCPRPAVVLSNPSKLFGPLRELTSKFWANPHKVTYIAGLEPATRRHNSLLCRVFNWLRQGQTRESVSAPLG